MFDTVKFGPNRDDIQNSNKKEAIDSFLKDLFENPKGMVSPKYKCHLNLNLIQQYIIDKEIKKIPIAVDETKYFYDSSLEIWLPTRIKNKEDIKNKLVIHYNPRELYPTVRRFQITGHIDKFKNIDEFNQFLTTAIDHPNWKELIRVSSISELHLCSRIYGSSLQQISGSLYYPHSSDPHIKIDKKKPYKKTLYISKNFYVYEKRVTTTRNELKAEIKIKGWDSRNKEVTNTRMVHTKLGLNTYVDFYNKVKRSDSGLRSKIENLCQINDIEHYKFPTKFNHIKSNDILKKIYNLKNRLKEPIKGKIQTNKYKRSDNTLMGHGRKLNIEDKNTNKKKNTNYFRRNILNNLIAVDSPITKSFVKQISSVFNLQKFRVSKEIYEQLKK